MPNGVRNVKVRVDGLSHPYPADIGLLVVGPRGHSAVVMSWAGCGMSIANVILTFDDAAEANLPDATLISSGTFRATDNEPAWTRFQAPAPAGPYAVRLDLFQGTDPNGTWRLYALDTGGGDSGSIGGGWSIEITSGGSLNDTRSSSRALRAPLATPAAPCTSGTKTR